MLTAARDLPALDADVADVAVIGGGAVGLCVAVDLARSGKKVLVLEAGGERVCPASQAEFEAARWSGYPLVGLRVGRTRALGGTTHLWGGQLATVDPIVFEQRPWVADAGWPVAAHDLADAYARAFALIGLDDRLDDDEVWRRLRMRPPNAGDDIAFFFTRWAPEKNFARLFDADLRCHPNLRVVLNAPVTELLAGGDGRTIRAARVAAAGGRRDFAARDFILANGSVEIARLLLRPAADGIPAPWAGSPWLGRGFIDHVDATAGRVTLLDPQRFHALVDSAFIGGLKYKLKFKLSEKTQRRDRLLDAMADFTFDSNLVEELAVLKNFGLGVLKRRVDGEALRALFASPRRAARLAGLGIPMAARYLRHRRTYNPGDKGIYLRLSTEQKPLADSRLRLGDGGGVEVAWAIDGAEVDAMAALAGAVAAFLEREGLARVALDERLRARSRDFLADIDDANHHMGMARMGGSPDKGVVDRNLRVFGTRNLHVAGAAVFPTSGAANPTFTAIALGLRLAKMLCEDRTG